MTAERSDRGPVTVAVLDDYQGVAASCTDWHAGPHELDVTFHHDHVVGNALVERLAGVQVLVVMRERTPLPASVLERLPGLELVVTTGARNASIDVAAARRAGVVACGTRSLVTPTAELTWGLILSALRGIPDEQAALRAGDWQLRLGAGLAGRTLGLLGLGTLGTMVARVARAFDMEVVAWSQNLTDERAADEGARRVGRNELFASADVLSVHLRLSERTRGLVGPAELGAMRPTAWLVNTSRAEIVDQEALLRALHEGAIAGAALDVHDEEPLPAGHPLLAAPRTLLTPHLGYVTRENYELFYSDAHEAVQRFLSEDPVRVIEPD